MIPARTALPRVLFVNTTMRCNVDCPRCYLMPATRAQRETLQVSYLAKMLADPFFAQYDGPVVVIYQGGEPQLLGQSRFLELVEHVAAHAPFARQTAVSNMYAAPDWFLECAREFFNGRIETTWASGRKHSLAGDADRYQKAFRASLKKSVEAGLVCPVNVELNDDTFEQGPEGLIEMMLETGARHCEFDISFDFANFRAAPKFGPGFVPFVPPTIHFSQISDFLLALRRRLRLEGLEDRVRTHSLLPLRARGLDLPFNTQSESRFVTLNPDGFVTTNPLYSDITKIGL